MYLIEFVDLQILRRQGLLCFSISPMGFELYGFKNCKNHPPSPIRGNNGPIVLVRGGPRFDANGNIHRNLHQNRSTIS